MHAAEKIALCHHNIRCYCGLFIQSDVGAPAAFAYVPTETTIIVSPSPMSCELRHTHGKVFSFPHLVRDVCVLLCDVHSHSFKAMRVRVAASERVNETDKHVDERGNYLISGIFRILNQFNFETSHDRMHTAIFNAVREKNAR